MKRTNKIILISVLVSLLLLGIGYAAIQNITLSISGFAELEAKADNFKVIFSETVDPIVSDSYYMTAERKSDIEAQMKLHNLSKAGETVSVIYTIENKSTDLSADLAVSVTNDSPEYITVNSQLEKTSIVAGEETTVEVTVTVTKTPIADNIAAKIGLQLIAMPVQPGEEGTSEGIKDSDQNPVLDERNEYGYYYDRFYYNEEKEWGFISHADRSAETFELFHASDYPDLEKDEWFCTDYYEAGDTNPDYAFANGTIVENDGRTIIDIDGSVYTMSNIIPHGVYINNRYSGTYKKNETEEEGIEKIAFLENNLLNITDYNIEGSIQDNFTMKNIYVPNANGYLVFERSNILMSFNVSGDLIIFPGDNSIYNLEEIHNYTAETKKEATCTENGEICYTCIDCSENYTVIISAISHKNDNDKNSICDECGLEIQYQDLELNDFMLWIIFDDIEEIKEAIIQDYFYLDETSSWFKSTSIENDAFDEFSSLETLVIPATITNIKAGAFEECYSLKTINYTGTEEQWNEIVIGERNDPLINATINFNYVLPTE